MTRRGALGESEQGVRFVVAAMVLASLVLVLWNLQDASLDNANTGSRYATVESVVDYGTYSIDQSVYRRTIDKVKVGEHYYSSKPPLLPTYAAGVYSAYRAVTGHSIADYEGEVVWLVSLATGWLSHALLLAYLWRTCQLLFSRELARLGVMAAACFAYLGAGYATTINNHSVGAAFTMAGFYHVLRARHAPSHARDWVLAGIWLGFLPSMDLPSAAFSAGLGLCLLAQDWRATLRRFVPAAVPAFAVQPVLTYAVTGSVIPAYMRKELYDYPGSYWLNEQGIDALREPKSLYAFHVLLGHHGLFSMTPLLIFAVIGLVMVLRGERGSLSTQSSDPQEMGSAAAPQAMGLPAIAVDRAVAVAALSGAVAVTLFLIFWSHNYGGWCVGMRWLVPTMAVLLIYFGYWLETAALTPWLGAALAGAFVVSAYNTQDALSGPFQYSRWHNWLESAPNRARTGDKINLGRARARESRQRSR